MLAETERDGHLPAFNAAFAEFGLAVRWSEREYGEKLRIAGGKERLASLLTPAFVAEHDLPRDTAALGELVRALHARKSEIFADLVRAGAVTARPGIARLARAAAARGWKLAVASTSEPSTVRAVLESVVGPDFAAGFAIFAGDVVPAKKPAPDIYSFALERLGVGVRDALVIEDSRIGLLAAHAAGLRCIVTPSHYTHDERTDEAILVVTSLGEPGGVRTAVIANRSGVAIGSYVTADDLRAAVSKE